jgi:hypothetical protein
LYRFLKQRGLSARHLTVDAPLKPLKKDWRIDFICNEDRELLTEWRRSKERTKKPNEAGRTNEGSCGVLVGFTPRNGAHYSRDKEVETLRPLMTSV